SFTKEDYAYGIGKAEYRITGTFSVSIDDSLVATVQERYTLALYKDWNFDKGKVAEPKPFGIAVSITLDNFADMTSKRDTREFALRGSSYLSGTDVVPLGGG